MILRVNGDDLSVGEGITVAGLVKQLGLGEGPVAVERNGQVIPRAEHLRTVLTEGDALEIVHFVGGG